MKEVQDRIKLLQKKIKRVAKLATIQLPPKTILRLESRDEYENVERLVIKDETPDEYGIITTFNPLDKTETMTVYKPIEYSQEFFRDYASLASCVINYLEKFVASSTRSLRQWEQVIADYQRMSKDLDSRIIMRGQ